MMYVILKFDIKTYIIHVLKPIFRVVLLLMTFVYFYTYIENDDVVSHLIGICGSGMVVLGIIYFLGLNQDERDIIKKVTANKLF